MGAFWQDAEGLFQTARQGDQAGSEDCDWAILIGHQGEIRMLAADGWSWAGLLADHEAVTTYRITRERGQVRVEGQSGAQSCRFEYASPAKQAHDLLDSLLARSLKQAAYSEVETCRRLT